MHTYSFIARAKKLSNAKKTEIVSNHATDGVFMSTETLSKEQIIEGFLVKLNELKDKGKGPHIIETTQEESDIYQDIFAEVVKAGYTGNANFVCNPPTDKNPFFRLFSISIINPNAVDMDERVKSAIDAIMDTVFSLAMKGFNVGISSFQRNDLEKVLCTKHMPKKYWMSIRFDVKNNDEWADVLSALHDLAEKENISFTKDVGRVLRGDVYEVESVLMVIDWNFRFLDKQKGDESHD